MIDFIWMAVIVAGGLCWFNSMKARERALSAVYAYCRQHDLQLLDDCVALSRFYPKLTPRGRLQFWRSYAFEFSSTGFERYSGQIVIFDGRVHSIALQAYREPCRTEMSDFLD